MKPYYLNWTGLFVQYPRSYVACTGKKFSLNVAKTAEKGIPSWFALPAHADRALAATIKHGVGGIGTLAFSGIDRGFGLKALDNYRMGLKIHNGNIVQAAVHAVKEDFHGISKLHNDMAGATATIFNLDKAHEKYERDNLEYNDLLHPSFHERVQRDHNAAKSVGHGHYVGGGSPRSESSTSTSSTITSKKSQSLSTSSRRRQAALDKAADRRLEASIRARK